MSRTALNLAALSCALLGLASCSSTSKAPPPPKAEGSYTFVEGVPGGVYVQTIEAQAKVVFVDKGERKLTLLTSDGKKTTLTAGPEVRNFDQIRVGDTLNVTMAEELVLHLAGDAPRAAPRDGAAALIALAPLGSKPGLLIADAMQFTATVAAIDEEKRTATLRFPDGSRETFPVRPDIDLTRRRVGEEVVVRSTIAMVLDVTGG